MANLESAEEIQPWIDARNALAVVQIPQDFERNLLAGHQADVQVIVDGRNSNTAGTALNYIGTITDSFNVAWNREHQGIEPPIRIESRAWYNPNLFSNKKIKENVQSSFSYSGCRNHAEFQEKAKLVKISGGGKKESKF